MCQFLECFLEPSVWGKYSFLGSSTKNFQVYAKLFWKQPPPLGFLLSRAACERDGVDWQEFTGKQP